MKATIKLTGAHGVIDPHGDRAMAVEILDGEFSFAIPGAEFSDAYQRKLWDGRKHLLSRMRDGEKLSVPSGLARRAASLLRLEGFEVEIVDARASIPWDSTVTSWSGFDLRPHQKEAVDAVMAAASPSPGEPYEFSTGGVLNEPVRSGKTLMAARIAFELGQRTVFVAPSDFLVAQARDVFRASLSGPRVSVVGLGEDDSTGDVVIASIATLRARRGSRWWEKFRRAFGVAFFDELHHLLGDGEEWRDTAFEIGAKYRFGLTGTLHAEERQIRLLAHALCGKTLHRTAIRDLTRWGYLTPLTIRFVRVNAPSAVERAWTRSTYSEVVVKCMERTNRLASEAIAYANDGHLVLVDTSRVGHAREFMRMFRGASLDYGCKMLTGDSTDEERWDTIAKFRSGDIRILVSTFLGEGVDIPELAVVINAEGGSASPSTIQRLRNLTPCEGKTQAILVEPIDDHHPTTAEWTLNRIKLYKAEDAFDIQVEPATAATPSRARPPRGRISPKAT